MAKVTSELLSLVSSLQTPEEYLNKRRELVHRLEKLINAAPFLQPRGGRLLLFGSCANSFGILDCDIDVCLAIEDMGGRTKAEIVDELAELLTNAGMLSVQALGHARVPIVKFTDAASGIHCDICINNILAVANTKLLRDYATIDPRLRQLAFVIKYWAKQRGVNETYRGTLSSYAYVIMCIHYLQQRRPPILPCLQSLPPTFDQEIEGVPCRFHDRVDQLQAFGAANRETLGELVFGFFLYWAQCHDYANGVISIRTPGGYLSKEEKEWTRRVGTERHLICVEDPFEESHDLGRVVDRFSIRVIREEFDRAVYIMRNSSHPTKELFEKYVRAK